MLLASPGEAAIVFSIDAITVAAGDEARVGVFARSDASESIDGFSLQIDVGADTAPAVPGGADPSPPLPAGITGLAADPVQSEVGGRTIDFNVAPFSNILAGSDIIVNMNSQPLLPLTSTPTQLFELVLNTDASFSGVVPLSIDSGPFSFSSASPATTISFEPGQITVTAVPEPSSLAALGLLAGGVAYRRRRKAAKVKAVLA
jgi:hypothetical protein